MKVIHYIALILVIIGALNWGLVGFFKFDLVAAIFGGSAAPISRVIYALVGLAGLWSFSFFKMLSNYCNNCKTKNTKHPHP